MAAETRYIIALGDLVIAKFAGFREREDDPWCVVVLIYIIPGHYFYIVFMIIFCSLFHSTPGTHAQFSSSSILLYSHRFAGTISNIDYDANTVDVVFEDGDESNGLELEEVRFCEGGRPATIGSDSLRCNSVFDLLAVAPNLKLAVAVLRDSLPPTSVAEPHVLSVGDLVIAKFAGFREKEDDPWCVASVSSVLISYLIFISSHHHHHTMCIIILICCSSHTGLLVPSPTSITTPTRSMLPLKTVTRAMD